MQSAHNTKLVISKLINWFEQSQRDLPWRRTFEPYHVWIAEIMLQQTQMERAVGYFNRWVSAFPTVESVAMAGEEQILKLWEGLGYYNRAVNLHRAAQRIVDKYQGSIPEDYDRLLELPGIGPYTAAAIASIAFNQDYPVVDANVERVLARLFDIDSPIKTAQAKKKIHRLLSRLLPRGKSRLFNQALMEMGALVCRKVPVCEQCPLKENCQALHLNIVRERPVPGRAVQTVAVEVASGILRDRGRVFIQKRPEHGVWANLWEFPGGRIEKGESPAEAVIREFHEETGFVVHNVRPITIIKHGYTKYRVTLHTFFCRLSHSLRTPVLHAAQEYRWVRPEELDQFAFPAGHRKLIDQVFPRKGGTRMTDEKGT